MQLDPVGFFAFAPAVVMLLLALNWGGSTYAWGSSTIIGLFSGAFAAAVVFLFWEYRLGNDSMIPFWMLKDRIIASCCLTGFLQAGAIVEMTYFMPIWFQAVRSDTPTMSGVDILPTVASQVVFAALTGVFGESSPVRREIYAEGDDSGQDRIPPALRRSWQCLHGRRSRAYDDPDPLQQHGQVGRISDPYRCRKGNRTAAGTSLVLSCSPTSYPCYLCLGRRDISSALIELTINSLSV